MNLESPEPRQPLANGMDVDMEPVAMRMAVMQMQYREGVHEWITKSRETVANFIKSREDEIRRLQEAEAAKKIREDEIRRAQEAEAEKSREDEIRRIQEAQTEKKSLEDEIRRTQEAQAEKLKRLNPKPTAQYSQPRPQPEKLCACPLNCDTKFSKEQKKLLHEQFRDKFSHFQQNKYVRRHLKIKSQGVEDKGKRITCVYLVPTIGSARESNRHVRRLNYDTVTQFLDTAVTHRNGFRPTTDLSRSRPDMSNDSLGRELTSEQPSGSASIPKINGVLDLSPADRRTDSGSNGEAANSPASMDDDDAASGKSDGDTDSQWDFSDDDESAIDYSSRVRYVGVCQKAFMNMYGITEKRIRWQREKLLQKMEARSQLLAEERLEEAKERRKEAEERDRLLSVARSLGAGCKPLFDMMTQMRCDHMFPQLLLAIVDDVDLVNNFFHNQLWKLEDVTDGSVDLATLFSMETESDQMKL